jgi:O-antigen/teichoic acid export membrane protein
LIAKKILQTGFVQIGTLFFGVVTGIFITRLLGPEGRGVYAVFKANADFLALFLGFGMGSAITFYASNRQIPTDKLLGLSVIGTLAGIVLVGLLILALPLTGLMGIAFPQNYGGSWFRGYLFLMFSVTTASVVFTGFLNGRRYFSETNFSKITNVVLLLGGVLLLFRLGGYGSVFDNTVAIFTLTLGTAVLNLVLLGALFFKNLRNELSLSFEVRDEAKLAWNFVYLVYLGELINFFNYRLDIWLVQYYESSYQLGLYTLAVSVSQMLWLIAVPVTIVLLPHLNNPEEKEQSRNLFFFIQESRLA